MKKKNKIKFTGGVSKGFMGRVYFSESGHTLDGWTGGSSYKLVWEIEIFGLKVVIWKKQ
jgi:hypothetical protein